MGAGRAHLLQPRGPLLRARPPLLPSLSACAPGEPNDIPLRLLLAVAVPRPRLGERSPLLEEVAAPIPYIEAARWWRSHPWRRVCANWAHPVPWGCGDLPEGRRESSKAKPCRDSTLWSREVASDRSTDVADRPGLNATGRLRRAATDRQGQAATPAPVLGMVPLCPLL
jgi:hypothetical protein